MSSKKEEKHTQRRKEILEAAERCFIKRGIHTCSMQQLCEEAKLSPGQVYRYYESKEDIILTLAEKEREATRELIRFIDSNQSNIGAAMQSAIPYIIRDITDGNYARMTLEFVGEASRNKAVADTLLNIEEELLESFNCAITESQKAGTLAKSLDPETTTALLLSLFDGVSGRSAFRPIKDKDKLIAALQDWIKAILS